MQPKTPLPIASKPALSRSLLYFCFISLWIIALSGCSFAARRPEPMVASEFRSLSFQEQLAFAKQHAGVDEQYELFRIELSDLSMVGKYEYAIKYHYVNPETARIAYLDLAKVIDKDEIKIYFDDTTNNQNEDDAYLDAHWIRQYLGGLEKLPARKELIAKIQINPLDLFDQYQAAFALQQQAVAEGATNQPIDKLIKIQLELMDKDPSVVEIPRWNAIFDNKYIIIDARDGSILKTRAHTPIIEPTTVPTSELLN